MRLLIKLTIAAGFFFSGLSAQSTPVPTDEQPALSAKTLQAERISSWRPVIDGLLQESGWQTARIAEGFVQMRPQEGAPASEKTEVRMLYDDDALYIGARLYDSSPDSVAGDLFRRDGTVFSDWFYVMVDSYNDGRTAFVFSVNPFGVKKDILVSNDTQEDASWDAVWDAAAHRDEQGWTAELRIPLAQLRFRESSGEQTWGLNFQRRIARKGEYVFWSPIPGDVSALVSRFGTLQGIQGLSSPARFELQPYAMSRLKRIPDRVPGNPFYKANDLFGSIGADFKYGLTSDFTLTGTVNPDFGQVEVDPAVVNLSAYETFFPERRPFFLEGSEIFSFGRTRNFNSYGFIQYFYSRRVGRPPQRGIGSQYVDVPDQTTILGAGKVSGKTTEGLSIGLLDAMTQEEEARYIDGSGNEIRTPVEPLTNYLVTRVKRDFDKGRIYVGGLLTAVNRSFPDAAFNSLMHKSSYSGGIDFEHLSEDRTWLVGGFAAGSLVTGDKSMLLRTQRSSARYYQRPDADYLDIDTNRTSLTGFAGELTLMKVGGEHWTWSLTYQDVSPGLEVNDMGFGGTVDRRAFSTYVQYDERKPDETFRNYGFYAFTNHAWNYGGNNVFAAYSAGGFGTFKNFWNIYGQLALFANALNDRLTRGGPLMTIVQQQYINVGGRTDDRAKAIAGLDLYFRTDVSGEYDRYCSLSFDFRPTPALQIEFSPRLGYERDTDQYITNVSDPMATTYGRRYVFTDIDLTRLSLDTRVDWTFTPNLSLQLYMQPLFEARDFHNFKEFKTPGTYDFLVYGRDAGTINYDQATKIYTVDPDGGGPASSFQFGGGFGQDDFNFRSLRLNLVVRWEYLPGSTIYVVWQHLRSNIALVSDFRLGRDVDELLGEPSDNLFLVKLSYWFGR